MILNIVIFGEIHLLSLLFLVILPVSLLIYLRDFVKENKKIFKIIILTIGFVAELTTPVGKLINGEPFDYFPFQFFCGFVLYIAIFALILENKKLFSILYFSLFGALFTFLFPSTQASFPEARYFAFFLNHTFHVLAAVYLMIAYDFRPTKEDWKYTVKWLLIFSYVVVLFNFTFDKNFWELAKSPVIDSLKGPLWTIIIITIVVVLQYGLYSLAKVIYKEKNESAKKIAVE